MIEIALLGKNAQGRKAKIDDADFELVKRIRWTYKNGYAISPAGVGMHRLIAGCTDRNKNVENIDGDRLNNQRENLRIVSRLSNGKKEKPTVIPTDEPGVWFNQYQERYAVILYDRDRLVNLGDFATIEEAKLIRGLWETSWGYTTKPVHPPHGV